jgi:hypothetical protein
LFLYLFVTNSMTEPPVIGLIVLKEGSAFRLLLLELDSGFTELAGGGGNISEERFHYSKLKIVSIIIRFPSVEQSFHSYKCQP